MSEIVFEIISELKEIAPYVVLDEKEIGVPFSEYDVHLDSIDVVRLFIAIENKFDVTFEPYEYLHQNDYSIQSLAELVMEKKNV